MRSVTAAIPPARSRPPGPAGDAAGQVVEQVVAEPQRVEAGLGRPGHRQELRPADRALDLRQLDSDTAGTGHPPT